MLLRGERRQHCARCGGGVRTPKATAECLTPGCVIGVDPTRSRSGLCVSCRARQIPQSRRVKRQPCDRCGGPLGLDNRTGFCVTCCATAGTCRIEDCGRSISAANRLRLCADHRRLWRKYEAGS